MLEIVAILFVMALTEEKRLEQARRLRRSQTPAEARLWSGLRGRRLQNHKFHRQYPIGPFTVDLLAVMPASIRSGRRIYDHKDTEFFGF